MAGMRIFKAFGLLVVGVETTFFWLSKAILVKVKTVKMVNINMLNKQAMGESANTGPEDCKVSGFCQELVG